ncbi:DUF3611 family protein [Leptolyngbya ohadii]|uniref:DUF3611 family protein n=1 Tax=Leptolyngbya ohadii TaxID=1962290 RepID=UPI000B59A264|nr:DUF3611 family protein [Leptolyngbya ohadii]
MQTNVEVKSPGNHLERVATILRITGWSSFVIQIALAATSSVLLILAASGRTFNQAIVAPPGIPGAAVATQATTPGLGVGIFWAVSSVLVLLFGIYLAFRLIRFGKRLRHPDPVIHPHRMKVIEVVRLGTIVGFVGMLLAILGTGTTLAVLLAKSVAQPQGVAIYDPNRIIRSLDIFVAAANTTAVTAHFIGAVVAAGVYNWLHRPSDPV